MKKKILPGIMAGAVILLAILITLIAALVNKYSPSKEVMDLSKYYNISSDKQVPIVLDYSLQGFAIEEDGELYLPNETVSDYISSRFYWDHNENILLYATGDALYSVAANESTYYKDKKAVSYDHVIVKPNSDGCYISISFVSEFVPIKYEVIDSPKRILLTTDFSDVEVASIKKKTSVRYEADIKSPILEALKKSDEVTLIEKQDRWNKVMTRDGVIGYVEAKRMSAPSSKSLEKVVKEETFYHDLKDKDVCLGWHYMENKTSNAGVANVIASTKGLNVISPTWFRLSDANGNVTDLASLDYVNYCHSQNIEVWALVNDFDTEEYFGEAVLSKTSTRQYLENQLISKALSYNLDGLNIDFEKIKESFVDDYLQFIRELAIKCHNNGIRLSVDNYMPADWNSYLAFDEQALFADYVVLMGYDEHWDGSDPGSVSSIGWVKSCVDRALTMVPEEQIVLAMPFYTRMYKYTPNANIETSDVVSLETSYKLSSKAYTMTGIDKIIGTHREEAVWDANAGQYYLEFTDSEKCICMVWLETVESLEGRMKVMDDKKLGGCAFWRLGQEKKECWDIVIKYLD